MVDVAHCKLIFHSGSFLHGNEVLQYRQCTTPCGVLQKLILPLQLAAIITRTSESTIYHWCHCHVLHNRLRSFPFAMSFYGSSNQIKSVRLCFFTAKKKNIKQWSVQFLHILCYQSKRGGNTAKPLDIPVWGISLPELWSPVSAWEETP